MKETAPFVQAVHKAVEQASQSQHNKRESDILEPLSASILSYLFWPQATEVALKLPKQISDAMDIFAKYFEALKTPRKVQWKPALGVVELAVSVRAQKSVFHKRF